MKKWFENYLIQFLGFIAYWLYRAGRYVFHLKEYIRNGQRAKRYDFRTSKERAIHAFMNTPGISFFESSYEDAYCRNPEEIKSTVQHGNRFYNRFHKFDR